MRMFRVTKLISLTQGCGASDARRVEDALRAAGSSFPGVLRAFLAPTMQGSVHGGDYMWHLQFTDEDGYRATIQDGKWRDTVDRVLGSGPVCHIDSVAYRSAIGDVSEPGLANGIYRTLFVSLRPGMPIEAVNQFQAEMCEMPRYIKAIRNWSFSPITEASGARAWTHVWEQDFRDLGGLQGPYMMHAHHWSFVDRWYDHECPDWIVDTYLCHAFCKFDKSVFASL
jgi:hypothetical protein